MRNDPWPRWLAAPWFVLALTALCDVALGGPAEDFPRIQRQCEELVRAGKYAEALPAAETLRRLAAGPLSAQPARTADALATLGYVYGGAGRYAEAEPLLEEALRIRRTLPDSQRLAVADSLNRLALLYRAEGRYAAAEKLDWEALAIRRQLLGPEATAVAESLNDLARVLGYQGRFAEAEPLCREALRMRRTIGGDTSRDVAQSLKNLALLYVCQYRYAEAEPLFREALAIRRKLLTPEHRDVAQSLGNLAVLYCLQGRYAEAQPLVEESLQIRRQALGAAHPAVATSLGNLAMVDVALHRYAAAETLLREALQLRGKILGGLHPAVADSLFHLAELYHVQGRDADAEPLADEALRIRDQAGVDANDRSRGYRLRAEVRWSRGRRDAALADLHRAMDLAEQSRARTAGAEWEQATAFAQHATVFEEMVRWQAAAGETQEAFAAIERSRARGLVEQMELHGLDLLAGLPPEQADALRRRDAEARAQLSRLQERLGALDDQHDTSPAAARLRVACEDELRKAQAAAGESYAAVRAASPAYRLAVGRDYHPVTLQELAQAAVRQQAVVLEYVVGVEDCYVLVAGLPGSPRLEALGVPEELAGVLGIEAGPLNQARLERALCNDLGTGVLQDLRDGRDPEAAKTASPALHALWQVLVPSDVREALAAHRCQHLIVIPDGPLAALPFETLVVQPEEPPQYLLDLGVAVRYAPSATVLMNLAERTAAAHGNLPTSILVAGGCHYGPPGKTVGPPSGPLTTAERYGRLGGRLPELPYAAVETAAMGATFRQRHLDTVLLQGEQATKRSVRSLATGRELLHLACHGLVDQTHGNLFGCLALTPGPNPTDPTDDGFLTLAEIYDWNLRGCQLVTLSACQTNVGPQQRGEGAWALSRGFLVAGSRRVVASNWLVNDQATAELMQAFCRHLAAAEGKQPLDYAQSLLRAKQEIRKQPRWSSPYYWGTFVLTGEN